ncbi:hypothetical protein FRC12_019506, partial [Ceratobasidium sp. 428]
WNGPDHDSRCQPHHINAHSGPLPTTLSALYVLVPIVQSVATPFSAQQALPSLLTTYPNDELALNASSSAAILVHAIRADPPVGDIVSNSPFPTPVSDFKPEDYTVATSLVIIATTIIHSSSVPSSLPHPKPTLLSASTDRGSVEGTSTWMSRHGRVLIWTVPLALRTSSGAVLPSRFFHSINSYHSCYAHNFIRIADAEVSDVLKILRLLKELGDLPYILDEYDISPGELRSYIDQVVKTRQSVHGKSTAETSVNEPVPGSPRNRYSGQEPSLSIGPTHPPSLSTRTDDSLATVFARAAALQKGIVDQGERFERRFDEIWAVIGSSPRREESRREELSGEEVGEDEMPAAGASGSVERRKTDMRAPVNMSPLAHRAVKRTGGRMTNGALPTPEPSRGRTWTQTTEPRTGDHRTATNDLENTRSVSFGPVAVSFRVRAAQGDGRNGMCMCNLVWILANTNEQEYQRALIYGP